MIKNINKYQPDRDKTMNTHTSPQNKGLRFALPVVFVATWFVSFAVFPWPAFSQGSPTGCAAPGAYSSGTAGFSATTIDMENVSINLDNNIQLDTGSKALTPDNIVIPFDQDISAVFLSEGMYNTAADVGWFVISNAYDNTGTLDLPGMWSDPARASQVHWLFRNIQDDELDAGCSKGKNGGGVGGSYTDGDGILDCIYDTNGTLQWHKGDGTTLTEADLTTWGYQVNNDGTVDNRDMRIYMGKFAAGTEIVFVDMAHRSGGNANGGGNGTFTGYRYTKLGWSTDENDDRILWAPSLAAGNGRDKGAGGISPLPFSQQFDLAECALESAGACGIAMKPAPFLPPGCETNDPADAECMTRIEGLLPWITIQNLKNLFNTTMSGTLAATYMNYYYDQPWDPWIVAAPPADPFKWILTLENLTDGGNADFNDIMIMVERKTGGVAALKSTEAVIPEAGAYITNVTLGVTDHMPCNGKTQIDYRLSIDNGATWVDITNADWQVVETPNKGGSPVANWVYGSPPYTYRKASINFQELGYIGRELLWKATLLSGDDACTPEVISVDLDFTATKNAIFSRSSPIPLASALYTGSFETPLGTGWKEMDIRGHEISQQIYDPAAPTAGTNIKENWDAGAKLKVDSVASRTVYTPNVTLKPVTVVLGTGDGSETTFTYTLTGAGKEPVPIMHASVSITDGVETFIDKNVKTLEGSLAGSGTVDRSNGVISVTFNTPPSDKSQIIMEYIAYKTGGMKNFDSATVDENDLGLDNSQITDAQGTRFVYDLDGDGAVNGADAKFLKNWVKGYRDGGVVPTEKEWLLAAIDRSSAAVVGSPGLEDWYDGTQTKQETKNSYDLFRCNQKDRRTAVYVGSKIGMLHSFDAGKYRPYYFDQDVFDKALAGKVGGCSLANLPAYRAALNPPGPGCKDTAGNPTYPGMGGTCATPTDITIINRGYYEHKAVATPDYGSGAENWAFIPIDQLPKLKNTYLGEADQASIDASPAAAYVQFSDKSWHTIIISSEGNGGDHVFALDVTDPAVGAKPKFLWEFSDPELFRSYSSPSVATIARTGGAVDANVGGKYVAYFVTGINNDTNAYPSIYAVDVEKGDVLARIMLDSHTDGKGGTPSGQPAVVDSDGDGFSDVMYIGTDKGIMYKINIPATPSGSYNVCTFANFGLTQPIQASPAVVVKNVTHPDTKKWVGNVVLVGTGDSPYFEDSPANAQYYFYALNDQNTTASPAGSSCGLGAQLWEKALPKGHRVFASAFATAGMVYFGTSTADTDDPCAPSVDSGKGEGTLFGLDLLTGDVVLQEDGIGNITSAPVVYDEHVFFRKANGETVVYGDNNFNNKLTTGGPGGSVVKSWKEITQ